MPSALSSEIKMPHRLKYLLQSAEWAVLGSILIKGLYWVFTFLAPIHEVLLAVCFLILVDLILGLLAMRRTRQKFELSKLFWSISKFGIYSLVVISGYVLEILVPGIPFARIFGGLMGVREGKSIDRNFNRIYGFDFFKAVKVWLSNRNRDWSGVKDEFRKQSNQVSPPHQEDQAEDSRPG